MAGVWRRALARQFARPSGWAGERLIGPLLDRIGSPMNRAAFGQLSPRPGEHILEVGFGGGDLLSWLIAAGARPTGIDPSAAMLRRARRRFRRELAAGEIELLEGSAERIPLADASVSRACSVNSIYFWEDLAAPLAGFARVLQPGGRLVLCFQTPEAVRAWPGHVHGFRAFAPEEVSEYMERAGFGSPRITSGSDPKVGEYVCLTSET